MSKLTTKVISRHLILCYHHPLGVSFVYNMGPRDLYSIWTFFIFNPRGNLIRWLESALFCPAFEGALSQLPSLILPLNMFLYHKCSSHPWSTKHWAKQDASERGPAPHPRWLWLVLCTSLCVHKGHASSLPPMATDRPELPKWHGTPRESPTPTNSAHFSLPTTSRWPPEQQYLTKTAVLHVGPA